MYVVGRIINPIKDVHILIPGTCECCLAWQRDSAGVIQLRMLRWGEYPGSLRRVQCDHKGIRMRQQGQRQRIYDNRSTGPTWKWILPIASTKITT